MVKYARVNELINRHFFFFIPFLALLSYHNPSQVLIMDDQLMIELKLLTFNKWKKKYTFFY